MIWYLISIYFLIVETAIVYIINAGYKKLDKRKLVNLFLSIKVFKILLSLIFIGVFYFVVKTGIGYFVTVFALFYLVSIGFETLYFVYKERQLKKKKKEE